MQVRGPSYPHTVPSPIYQAAQVRDRCVTPPHQGMLTRQSSFLGPGEALGTDQGGARSRSVYFGTPSFPFPPVEKAGPPYSAVLKMAEWRAPLRARKGLTSQPMGIYSYRMDRKTEKDSTRSGACTCAHAHTCMLTHTSKYTSTATSAAP